MRGLRLRTEKSPLHIPLPELWIQRRLLGLMRMKATISNNAEMIDATLAYNPKEFKMDSKGYFLIRINRDTGKLEAGYCRQSNAILKVFSGNNSKELMQAIIRAGIVSRLEHAEYLGRETMKAEMAKKLGIEYVQDSELNTDKD